MVLVAVGYQDVTRYLGKAGPKNFFSTMERKGPPMENRVDRGLKSEGFEELIQSDFGICDAESFLL